MEKDPSVSVAQICRDTLEQNWRDDHTIPAGNLYPHQWLWDSAFIAIGLRHIDIDRAQTELRSLLKGQWANGMLPHIIFAEHEKASRDRYLWQAWRNPNAPEDVNTTGMTQPPVLAEAVVKIGEKLNMKDRRAWYLDMYQPLVDYHSWLYRERDPQNDGLALLIHPWESGLDSSPPWIDQLHMHSKPWWINLIDNRLGHIAIRALRRDTRHVPPGQRMNDIDILMYMNVMQRLKRKDWDIERILARSHFAVEDVAFNSILLRANEHLETIAKTVGHELPQELQDNIQRSKGALEELWDTGHEQYFSRNALTHHAIKEPTIATLLPLYAGTITKERAKQLVQLLHDKKQFDSPYPVPSVPFTSTYYNHLSYWQGPTWINTNWLIADGLERYGFKDEAKRIRQKSVELVAASGPYEYFSAKDGTPAGAKNFSWTAALVLDMLSEHSLQLEN